MGLFGNKHEPAATTTTETVPQRKSTLFRSSNTPATTTTTHHTTNGNTSPHRGVLHRDHEDTSITSARERVMRAEAAERDADRALLAARSAVKDAREHVKRLEREAAEEARLAKIKQKQASAIGKRGKALGRHDHV